MAPFIFSKEIQMADLVKIEVPDKPGIVDFMRQVAGQKVGEFFIYPGNSSVSTLRSVADKYSKKLGRKFSVRKVDGKVAVGVVEVLNG
jgi:hypothetical protein